MDGKTASRTKSAISELRALTSRKNLDGMARFGINTKAALGVSVTSIRKIARPIGKDHGVASALWASGIHEARILASIVDVPEEVTEGQMERWVREFDSWDLCDQVCGNLFDKTRYAKKKVREWSAREREYEKRAGFTLIAALASHDKGMADRDFVKFLPIIEKGSFDGRNFVRKAVNWALRGIGKRNKALNRRAIASAERIKSFDSRSARWIASDALRELKSRAVQVRLNE